MKKKIKAGVIVMGAILVVVVFAGCIEEEIPSPSLPMSGEWTASPEFGEFVFTVNPDSTCISKIYYQLSNWTCGPITWPITSFLKTNLSHTQGARISTESYTETFSIDYWPITLNQEESYEFSITSDLGNLVSVAIGEEYALPFTIRGKFDESGTHASGSWEAVSSGVTCSGTWDAEYCSNGKSGT